MIFRLSTKLAAKLKVAPSKALPLDENPFADWSAHLFTAERAQFVIVTNTASLYSTVFYGRGISVDSHFIERALRSLREFMDDDGLAFLYQKFVAPASNKVQWRPFAEKSSPCRGTGSKHRVQASAVQNGMSSSGRVGNRLNTRDVLSPANRQVVVESLAQFDPVDRVWKETLVEDRHAGPAETAAARLDFGSWFRSLPIKRRHIAALLADGEMTKAAARKSHVSPGRVSQVRRELAEAWQRFQAEPAT